jgi:hypothetical protein
LSAQSAKISHTDWWSICFGKLEGFRGIFDLALCTVLGRNLLKYLSSLVVGFAAKQNKTKQNKTKNPRMVGTTDMI